MDRVRLKSGTAMRNRPDSTADARYKIGERPFDVDVVQIENGWALCRTPDGKGMAYVPISEMETPPEVRPKTVDEMAIAEALRARGHAVPGEDPIDYTGIDAHGAELIRGFEQSGRHDIARQLADQARAQGGK